MMHDRCSSCRKAGVRCRFVRPATAVRCVLLRSEVPDLGCWKAATDVRCTVCEQWRQVARRAEPPLQRLQRKLLRKILDETVHALSTKLDAHVHQRSTRTRAPAQSSHVYPRAPDRPRTGCTVTDLCVAHRGLQSVPAHTVGRRRRVRALRRTQARLQRSQEGSCVRHARSWKTISDWGLVPATDRKRTVNGRVKANGRIRPWIVRGVRLPRIGACHA